MLRMPDVATITECQKSLLAIIGLILSKKLLIDSLYRGYGVMGGGPMFQPDELVRGKVAVDVRHVVSTHG